MPLIFGSNMKTLDRRAVRWLVFHTAGTPDGADTSAAAIHRYHRREKGWAGIGYHFVIRKDGTIETGRSLTKQGAHVAGLNDRSLAVAFSGNGDIYPLTEEQIKSGLDLGSRLCRLYMIDVEDVIGHRGEQADRKRLRLLGLPHREVLPWDEGVSSETAACSPTSSSRLQPL